MAKKEDLRKHSIMLAEKRTHLSEKRTELAHERTIMANIRTATTVTLFGVAFFGFSKAKWDLFYGAGIVSITFGIFFAFYAVERATKHSKEIKKIKGLFEKILKFKHGKPY